jgi:uncharacterized protein YgiM (DUF1202 family)
MRLTQSTQRNTINGTLSRRALLGRATGLVAAGAIGTLAIGLPRIASAAPQFTNGERVYVNTNALNLRDGYGLDSEVIHVLWYGDSGQVIDGPVDADGYAWYQVNFGGDGRGLVGWVAGAYLAEGSGPDQPPSSEIDPGDTVEVADGPLNLREGPGLGYDVIISFATGTRLLIGEGPVAADGYTWFKNVPGGDAPAGWLAGEFLEIARDGGDDPGANRFEVVNGPLNVRAQAGLDAAIIGSAPTGAQGVGLVPESVQMDGYMWSYVGYDSGLRGWIALDFVDWL